MSGARHRILAQGPARPLVLVMVGTAVTVEAIDTEGRFLGGLILPGHGIMLRALESGTAGLRVPTGEVREFPTNTSDALTSGGNYAITGAIERMHRHLAARCAAAPVTLVTAANGNTASFVNTLVRTAPVTPTPVPGLGGMGAMLLTGLIAGLAGLMRRRKSS